MYVCFFFFWICCELINLLCFLACGYPPCVGIFLLVSFLGLYPVSLFPVSPVSIELLKDRLTFGFRVRHVDLSWVQMEVKIKEQ